MMLTGQLTLTCSRFLRPVSQTQAMSNPAQCADNSARPDCDPSMKQFFNYTALVFLVVFNVEMICKIIALGWCQYYSDPWNKFDFYVTILGWLDPVRTSPFRAHLSARCCPTHSCHSSWSSRSYKLLIP